MPKFDNVNVFFFFFLHFGPGKATDVKSGVLLFSIFCPTVSWLYQNGYLG